MGYNQNVPATGHSASQDYSDIQGNFAQIQSSFSVNHEPLASGGGTEGYHTQIQFANVSTDPGKLSPVTSLYTKTSGGSQQLFFQNAASIFQLTKLTVTNVGNNYGVTTPWGLILNWGLATTAGGGSPYSVAVSYAVPFNTFQSVTVTPHNSTGIVTANTSNELTTGFTIYSSAINAVYYFAIGV